MTLKPDTPEQPPRRRFFLNWPRILAAAAKLIARLSRYRILGDPVPERGPVIYITWHSEEITMLPVSGFTRGTVMVSNSKDGDILAAVVERWGYRTSRGSSSKGAAAALLGLRRALERGENIILAVDGPRGPRHEAKPGCFYLAARTGAWICPVGVAVSRAYVFRKSWSLSRVPLPGSRVCAVFGGLYRPEGDDLSLSREAQCAKVKSLLDRATEEAGQELENWRLPCTRYRRGPAGRGNRPPAPGPERREEDAEDTGSGRVGHGGERGHEGIPEGDGLFRRGD
ncbi:MAG: DUF374 domain-containing protein [Deltaproteobacteria bacterium]|jgi:lysophospholipid acyltransferase (LPLAT)-like uncharacterized protein|nr:DUF374 domain-containing protein [Deltaproteobacteria bacterium]